MHAAALGLGEVTLESRLNEPLQLRIALVGGNLEAATLNAALASEAQHSAAGIESIELLKRLRAEVFTPSQDEGYVRVSTEQSIREPVVRFLIVVENARERVMREYTVLLDPPGYSLPGIVTPRPRPQRLLQPTAAEPPARAPAPRGEIHPRHIGPVARGTTLSKLAMDLERDPGVTWAQMTWALFTANPHAFIEGDINRLRSGVYLQVPRGASASRWSHREAVALINGTPAERVATRAPASAPAAPRREPAAASRQAAGDGVVPMPPPAQGSPAPTAEAATTPQPLFRLASPDDVYEPLAGGAVGVPMTADESKHMDDMIALANRQLQHSQEEIARARYQLAETARQISTLVETVAQKDLEIKGLEDRIADLRQFTREQSMVMARSEPNWMNRLLLEALLLAAMVVVLAVTLSRWTDARRRRQGGREMQTLVLAPPARIQTPAVTAATGADDEIESGAGEEECAADGPADEGMSIDHLEVDESAAEGDPLMEANAYFAYGYHAKAKDVLAQIIKQNPGHAESRLIMLRVLHAMREKRKFRRHAEALLELVDDRFDERWAEAARLGRALFPEERLFNADAHKRSEDTTWEETIWTGTRPDVSDLEKDAPLDADEFKYVDLFLLDEVENAELGDSLDASSPPPSEREDLEAELAEWRPDAAEGSECGGISLDRAEFAGDASEEEPR